MGTTTAHAHTCREDVLGGIGLAQRRDAVATAEDVENAQLQVRLTYQPASQRRRHSYSDVTITATSIRNDDMVTATSNMYILFIYTLSQCHKTHHQTITLTNGGGQ